MTDKEYLAKLQSKIEEKACKHCEFLGKVFPKDMTNREYWIMTEVFVYLHGSDECS